MKVTSKRIALFVFFTSITMFFLTACKNEAPDLDLTDFEKILEERIEAKLNNKLSEPYFPMEAQQIEQDEELIKISTSIIKNHAAGDLDSAFEIIRKYAPLQESDFNTAKEKSITQLELIEKRFGGLVGYEFVNSERIGNAIVRHDCIVKYRTHIIRWEFFYYKPEDKWVLNTFSWDDKIRSINNG